MVDHFRAYIQPNSVSGYDAAVVYNSTMDNDWMLATLDLERKYKVQTSTGVLSHWGAKRWTKKKIRELEKLRDENGE
jgi:hypothetical protein